MTINEEINGEVKTIIVSGRVDTTTSMDLQNYMLNSFMTHKHIIMDFSDVDYVSSSGIRVFLMAQKTATSKGGSFAIRNVTPAVRNILEIVTLDKVIDIQ